MLIPTPIAVTAVADTDSGAVDQAKMDVFLSGNFHALSEAAVVAWRISAAFSLLAPLVLFSTLLAIVAPGLAGVLLLISTPALFGILVWWLPKARWRRWRWRLGPEALHLRFGVLIRRSEHVPYFRIQHIELVNGPIERWLGLTTLTVTTASASGAAVLPGMSQTDAPALREALLLRAQAAVAEHGEDSRDAV
ncbi:MAG: PH domain-containing protein [Nitriliruptoraceae bacterium]